MSPLVWLQERNRAVPKFTRSIPINHIATTVGSFNLFAKGINDHRRKSNVTTGSSTDPLSIDMDMLDLLSIAAMEGTAETCIIVAKFLSTLISKETGDLLTDADVDQFIVINGYTLCKWCVSMAHALLVRD